VAILLLMATNESALNRSRRRGREAVRRLVTELAQTRRVAGLSQGDLARRLGRTQADISRLERLVDVDRVPFVLVAEVASLLGLELGVGLHRFGDTINDSGHQALIKRFRAVLGEAWRVVAEVPLPNPGDPRTWDLVLRIPTQVVGVEAETRIRDVQRLVRHIHQRERDGGTNVVVLVLADTRANRALLPELLEALGPAYATTPRQILRALRAGQAVPSSGVVLL
jgi:transcriptional regulator with XRE-family HTH domain